MARIDNLTNFLTDVADSIRTKSGTTDLIPAQNFDTEIENLPSLDDYFNTEMNQTNNAGMYLLKKLPDDIVVSTTNLRNAFNGLRGLETIPLIDTSNAVNMLAMFSNCNSLTEIPLIDTGKVIDMQSMFNYCTSLTTIPQLDTSSVTTMNGMFWHCEKLESIPLLETTTVTNMSGMFNSCYLLTTIPEINIENVTIMNGMFEQCHALVSVPQLNASKVVNISNAFTGCTSLTTMDGLLNLGQGYLTTATSNYPQYTLNLSTATNLTYDSLMNVINNLYDIATAGVQQQQLILGTTNLAKLTDEEIAIATSKGWAVS